MKQTLSLTLGSLMAVAALGFGAGQADATTYTGSGINPATGMALSASANFEIVGGNLQITLINIGGQAIAPSDVLTGIFFHPVGFGPLTPVSALLSTGSTVVFGPNGGGNVGGEWAYVASTGNSTAGLGIFGQANFNGANLSGSTAVQGLNYGIVSAVDNTAVGNAPVTGGNPLIQGGVVFTLSSATLLPGTFTAANFSNVSFQYGTALNEPNLVGQCTTGCTSRVPEPSSMFLLGSGLVGLAAWKRRKAS